MYLSMNILPPGYSYQSDQGEFALNGQSNPIAENTTGPQAQGPEVVPLNGEPLLGPPFPQAQVKPDMLSASQWGAPAQFVDQRSNGPSKTALVGIGLLTVIGLFALGRKK